MPLQIHLLWRGLRSLTGHETELEYFAVYGRRNGGLWRSSKEAEAVLK
jgi:hypothetical protein